MSRRWKILVSAYACEPEKGSEPAVGWHTVTALSALHDVWVLTRSNNRPALEKELSKNPRPGLHMVYFDLSAPLRRWKRYGHGVQWYYYLWQRAAERVALQLHAQVGFDAVHHLTLVKYWNPSLCRRMDVPFLWGPVAGGEDLPRGFSSALGLRGRWYEALRDAARRMGELDPGVRTTARRSTIALAATPETAERLRRLGAPRVEVQHAIGISQEEWRALDAPAPAGDGAVRFMSAGRLLPWKGFALGLRAFAKSGLKDAAYWIAGDGPDLERLRRLAHRLRITDRVHFLGALAREDLWDRLRRAHVLVHPSLHESGGLICLEAMSAGRPVLCLDQGGPGRHVTAETGIRVPVQDPEQVARDLAEAMTRLARDPDLCARMGARGRERVHEHYLWDVNADVISRYYARIVNGADSSSP